jgi:hypothetical protein
LVILIALGLTVPTGAPAHQFWTTATGSVSAQAPADVQAAIQQVIQQSNQEQAQAVASGNPSVMSDTATAAFYRQQVQTNQALVAQGVTAIELTNVTWGPINITGNTARVTTYETWITTFSDGTTAESTDTNLYTMVLQGGSWLIQSDQQPTSAAGQPTPAVGGQAPVPTNVPVPALPVGQSTSHNWSGYAATSATYTGVSGTWTVPQPNTSGSSTGVGATWVGIGGVSSHDLIQAGTQDVSAGGGQAQFQTWIETLPQASQQVPLAVAPGDSVTVSIDEQSAGSGLWTISITNNTSGQSYHTSVNYTSTQSSAEWIEEAPSGSSGVLPLDNFNSVSFTAATAVVNGQTVDLMQASAQPITMVNSNGQALAVPSGVASDGSSFNVVRTSAPATAGGGGRGQRPAGTPPGTGTGG